MNIGLYFGSFNPIHHGHLIIANYVATHTDLDQVWFVVSPQNPLKKSGSLLNERHRKHLVDLAIEGEIHLKSSDIEFKLPKPSYTVETLAYLKEKYPQHHFAIIMGSDSFSNLKNWKNYKIILEKYPIFIYKRPGFPVDSSLLNSQIKTFDAPLLDISSTQIREMIHQNISIRYWVPDAVMGEIKNQQFYL